MPRMYAVAVIGLALVAPTPAQRTLVVPTQYRTIAAAISAAKSGETVLVEPGLYSERIDFGGKTIQVRSCKGAAVTTIQASGLGAAAVRIVNGEGPNAILEGFTIRGGTSGGVVILSASPTLRSCCIQASHLYRDGGMWSSAIVTGAGLYCASSSARLVGCEIRDNSVRATVLEGLGAAHAYGGGLYAAGCALVVEGCMFTANKAQASAGFSAANAEGGGIYLDYDRSTFIHCLVLGNAVSSSVCRAGGIYVNDLNSSTRFLHCNVGGNQAWWAFTRTGSGVVGGTFTNCIVRQNFPLAGQFAGSATYSNIEGGASGTGNLDADPKFVDQSFHLAWDSPCRNKGTNAVSGLPATDWEGHPRKAEGTADVGFDEFFARLLISGTPSPGRAVDISIFGQPRDRTYWAFSRGSSHASASIPGLEGWFMLDPTAFALIDLGFMPSGGMTGFRFAFAPTFPSVTVSVQALVGKQLSNRVVLDVK